MMAAEQRYEYDMQRNNIDIVRQGYDAHRRGDYTTVFALLDPDVVLSQTEQLPWGGLYRGHDGARSFFGKLAEHIDSEVVPDRYIEAGDRVAVTGRVHGHVRSNGAAFDLSIVHIWTVEAGRATRFEAYIDTPRMLRALAGHVPTPGAEDRFP